MQFDVFATEGRARHGRLTLTHGVVQTPMFMPVGTYGTVEADGAEVSMQVQRTLNSATQ